MTQHIPTHILTIDEDSANQRLDRCLMRAFPDLTFSRVGKLLRTGQVRLDGSRAKGGERLRVGQKVRLPPQHLLHNENGSKSSPQQGTRPEGPLLNLKPFVIYEDNQIIALNKPSGLAVQGGTGIRTSVDSSSGTLRKEGEPRLLLVHRLDKDTSGLLLLAKTLSAARMLTRAFRSHDVKKTYLAVVVGRPPQESGIISTHLEKGEHEGREKMLISVEHEGLLAQTEYTLLGTADEVSLLELRPLTGRTHQLRVHCAHLQCPIVGDGKYGGRAAFPWGKPCGLHLHAKSLYLPEYHDLMVEAPSPPHMEATFHRLGWYQP